MMLPPRSRFSSMRPMAGNIGITTSVSAVPMFHTTFAFKLAEATVFGLPAFSISLNKQRIPITGISAFGYMDRDSAARWSGFDAAGPAIHSRL